MTDTGSSVYHCQVTNGHCVFTAVIQLTDTEGLRSVQSPETDMAFDCATATPARSSSGEKSKHTNVKDNRTTLLGKSTDWSEFEGVKASGKQCVCVCVCVCVVCVHVYACL